MRVGKNELRVSDFTVSLRERLDGPWRALARDRRLGRAEVCLAAAFLALVTVAAFGYYAVHGGLYSDDWSTAASYRSASSPRYLHTVAVQARELGNRPLLAVLLPLPTALFGAGAQGPIVLGLLLGVAACLLLFVFLRTLGLETLHSGLIAVLVLLFPWADSIRLWVTASLNNVALCLGLGGLLLALQAFRREGRAASFGHVAAVALFVLSILTYEAMGVALLLTGLVYRGRGRPDRARRWWAVDAFAVVVALAYTVLTTPKDVGSPGAATAHVPVFLRETSALISLSFVPPGVTSTVPRVLVLLTALVVVVLAVRRFLRVRSIEDRRWLVVLAAACASIACAYATFLPSLFTPLATGINNRVNLFAALGYVTAVYAIAMLVGRLIAPRRTTVVGVALVLVVGAGYAVRLAGDERAWARSAALQETLLERLSPIAENAASGTVVVSFGFPAAIEDGPPIFEESWAIDDALHARGDGRIAHAYPYFEGATITCGVRALTLKLSPTVAPIAVPYTDALLFDAVSVRGERVRGYRACTRRVHALPRAPRAVRASWRPHD